MDALHNVVAALQPDSGRRDLAPWELESIGDVLDAAQAWADGDLPWHQAATYGTILSPRTHRPDTRYSRFVASLWAFRKNDPRRRAVVALCTEIERMSGMEVTEQGIFSAEERRQHDHARDYLRTKGDQA